MTFTISSLKATLKSTIVHKSVVRTLSLSSRTNATSLRKPVARKMAINGVNGTRAKHDISALKVNQSRLLEAIHTGCKYGAAHKYGE